MQAYDINMELKTLYEITNFYVIRFNHTKAWSTDSPKTSASVECINNISEFYWHLQGHFDLNSNT